MSKWLEFKELPNEGRKTKVFGIRNKRTDFQLGHILWHTGFRKYAFYPTSNTVFDPQCLEDIIDFIKKLMNDRRKDR